MGSGPVAPALVGQGQQLAGLTPEAQVISNAHCKFLPPCRTRQKPGERASPVSFPLGRQPGGCVAGVCAFAQVKARSPSRERFLARTPCRRLSPIEVQPRPSISPEVVDV